MAGLVEPASSAGIPKGKIDWPFLTRCLSFGSVNAPQFESALVKACMLGAYPLEVIAGTPRARYGARMTLHPPAENSEFLAAFGLDKHPWGPPDSVGFRTNDKGQLVVKAYHRVVQPLELPFHEKLSGQLITGLGSLHQGATEIYFVYNGECPWKEFASTCLESLGTGRHDFDDFDFQPYPRSAPRSFFVSAASQEGAVQAISLYAYHRVLPDDETISRLWTRDLPATEREAYELSLAAVRSCGARRFGGWHSMLGWTFERNGSRHKAASLYFPVSA